MPEPTSTRSTRAYRRGYLNALREAAKDVEVLGDPQLQTVANWLRSRAARVERDGIPRKEQP